MRTAEYDDTGWGGAWEQQGMRDDPALYERGLFRCVPHYEPCPGQWLVRMLTLPGGGIDAHREEKPTMHNELCNGAGCTIESWASGP